MAFLLAASPTLSAQSGCDWSIEICTEAIPSNSAPTGCEDDCFRVFYYVYLVRTGDQNDTTQRSFEFKELNLFGGLSVTSSNLSATGKLLSGFNAGATFACSPSNINDDMQNGAPVLSLESSEFAYQVSSNDAQSPTVSWNTLVGRNLLFILAVEAFPDEDIDLVMQGGYYVLANNTQCNFQFDVCSAAPSSSLVKSLAVPSACSAPFQIRFGAEQADPTAEFPNRRSIPVYVSAASANTTFEVEELDLLIDLSSTQLMAMSSVEPGLIGANELDLYPAGPNTSSTEQRLYVHGSGFEVLTGPNPTVGVDNTLFTIYLNGPSLASDCGDFDLELTDFRRLKLKNTDCCQPKIGTATKMVSWSGPPCPTHCNTVKIAADPLTTFPGTADECADAFFDILLSSVAEVTYENVTFVIDVTHSGDFAWNAALTTSSYCSPITACIDDDALSSTVTRLTFSLYGSSVTTSSGLGPVNLARIAFSGTEGCIEAVVFRDAVLENPNTPVLCIPTAESGIRADNQTDNICLYRLSFSYLLEDGAPIKDVEYRIQFTDPMLTGCDKSGLADGLGQFSLCPCDEPEVSQTITPFKTDYPLLGVSTFDLVRISQHILNIQALDSPYKIIAADANGNGSVAASDILELRKLILGVYSELPGNTSFRFVSKDFTFTNPVNPFLDDPAEYDRIDFEIPPSNIQAEFIAIKVGDVNNSICFFDTDPNTPPNPDQEAVCGPDPNALTGPAQDREAPVSVTLGYDQPLSPADGTGLRELPIFFTAAEASPGGQLFLRYDTAAWRLRGLRWSAVPGEGRLVDRAWHEPRPGDLRILWFDGSGTATHYAAGEPLFYLQFEAIASGAAAAPALHYRPAASRVLDEQARQERALAFSYRPGEARRPPERPIDLGNLTVAPNPAAGVFRLQIVSPAGGRAVLRIVDAFGRLVYEDSGLVLAAGQTTVPARNLPALGAGTYTVQVTTAAGCLAARLVQFGAR